MLWRMRIEITHKTRYIYSDQVFFEPHYLRLKPKNTIYASVEDHGLKIDPQPAGISEHVDMENNQITMCWFENMHRELKLESTTRMDVSDFDPFNFLVYPPEFLEVPFAYDRQAKLKLSPSMQTVPLPVKMNQFLDKVLKDTGNSSVAFLTELTNQIHKDFVLESRDTGEPNNPELTFEQKTGSCRDLAWMQIHLLRQKGIAARFVSGYFYPQADAPEYELHAWVEAYLPGAGWIGMDPGHGIITGNRHFPVASSADFENTMPVTGSIRGDAGSELWNEVSLSMIKQVQRSQSK